MHILWNKVKLWFKNDKKVILISLLIGILATGFTGYNTKQYSDNIHEGLKNNLIRFHVIANSDSEQDQELKLKVRDAVLKEMSPLLNESESIEQSKQIILDNKKNIQSIAENIIKSSDKNYSVTVNLEEATFPTKKYGDIVLPAGDYEALRIIIGEGKGKNWWCVMFPPLCFVDITHGTVPEETKEELKNVLTDEEYKIVALTEEEQTIPVKIKFKIVEWWQENKGIQTMFAHK